MSHSAGRRTVLPAPCKDNSHIGIMTILYNNIGKDLSRVSMPVALNEPLSLLQRLSEELEYSDLLDIANQIDDPYERMVRSLFFFFFSRAGLSQVNKVEIEMLNISLSGLRGSVFHLGLRLGVLEVSLQALQPGSGRNLREPPRGQRLPLCQRAGNDCRGRKEMRMDGWANVFNRGENQDSKHRLKVECERPI